MAKFEMQIETGHPILFIGDSGGDITIPDVTEGFATASRDCVAFYVLSYVDGASVVTVSDQACPLPNARHMFHTTIFARSGVLTVSDSAAFSYLNIPTAPDDVQINIWANDAMNPDWVWIQLGSIRTL